MALTIYDQTVNITKDYLGPAAERFVQRQIHFHLHKDPTNLTKDDIPQLAEWVKVSISVLTEDTTMVNDFTKRILELSK